MTFVVTQQARMELEKRRKERNREAGHPEPEPAAASDAHAQADGTLADFDRERQAAKSAEDRGATPGPGTFPEPGHPAPEDARRGYIAEGHAAPSPQQEPPHQARLPEGPIEPGQFRGGYLTEGRAEPSPSVRHVDLTGSRASARPVVFPPSGRVPGGDAA